MAEQSAKTDALCECVGYTIRTDYGTGVEHDTDRSSCPAHGGGAAEKAHMVEVSDAGVHVCRVCGYWGMRPPPIPCTTPAPVATNDPTVFIGSIALIAALYETYREHIGITETDGPDGPYIWCACGWRSDELGRTALVVRDELLDDLAPNHGEGYAVHLTNAQHAAAVKALQPIVRRVTGATS